MIRPVNAYMNIEYGDNMTIESTIASFELLREPSGFISSYDKERTILSGFCLPPKVPMRDKC